MYDHEERDPTALELVSSAMGKLLDSKFDDYSYSRTEQHKIFESKDLSIVAECSLIPMPIKLFDITLTRAHVTDKPDTAFKLLQIQNIRQALSSRLSWSPLKEIMTDEISNFQSSNLFHVMNKSGITYSYFEDEKHHNDAKFKLDGERSKILLNIQSNCHLHQIDNLETRMQYAMMLSTNEKLLHFMTQQLVYIQDFNPHLDFFCSQPSYLLQQEDFECSSNESELIDHFSDKFIDYVMGVMQTLYQNNKAEEFIQALSASESNNPVAADPRLDIKQMPKKRILDDKFEGNLSEDKNKTFEKVYYRIDALSSTNIFDTKTLIDMTMREYQLDALKYIENSEYHPMSPLMFLSCFPQHPEECYFRHIFGKFSPQMTLASAEEIVKTLSDLSDEQMTDTEVLNNNYDEAFALYQDCVSNMITQKNGLTSCAKNFVTLAKTSHKDLSFMAHIVLFEIFRKLKFWYPAHCLADVIQNKIDNGSFMEIDKCTLLKLKTNHAMTLFYLQEYDKAFTCCQHMIDNYGDSKVLTDLFPVVTLIAACFIMQNKLDEALQCMENNMKLLAYNVITSEHTKHSVFLLNMSVIYF